MMSCAILGMQFTEPFIADAVKQARAANVEQIVALPVYPLCGPSTTVAALERVEADHEPAAVERAGPPDHRLAPAPGLPEAAGGCHPRPAGENGCRLDDPRTKLVFSAHGTPMKYIEEGSRYDIYVRDFCADLARAVGAPEYVIGYQNHTNRPIEWTQPDVESVIAGDRRRPRRRGSRQLHARAVGNAGGAGPRAEGGGGGTRTRLLPRAHPPRAPAFIAVLADLVEPFLAGVEQGGARRCPGAGHAVAELPLQARRVLPERGFAGGSPAAMSPPARAPTLPAPGV
jgi:protoporphyrin/coproporphyrin ferrochelatase